NVTTGVPVPDAAPEMSIRASGTGRYRMPLTMLKPSDHQVLAVPGSIVAVMPVALVPLTHFDACMPFVAATAACDVTVPAVAQRLSCTRVWLVVVDVDWLHQARVNSADACAGTRTWLMVMAVDAVTAARMSVYSPEAAAMASSSQLAWFHLAWNRAMLSW